jgi:hypothetical protein
MKLRCVCGGEYWRAQSWQHEGCATNRTATNGVRLTDATNRRAVDGGVSAGDVQSLSVVEVVGEVARASRTANRRTRESYNAYQREYMRSVRKKRALAG